MDTKGLLRVKLDHCTCTLCSLNKCEAIPDGVSKKPEGKHHCCWCKAKGYGFPISVPPTIKASIEYLNRKKKDDDRVIKAAQQAFNELKASGKPVLIEAQPSSEFTETTVESDDDSPDDHCRCPRCYNAMCKTDAVPPESIPHDDFRCCNCVRGLMRSPKKLLPWEERTRSQFHKVAKAAGEANFFVVSLYDSLGVRDLDRAVATDALRKARDQCQSYWSQGRKVPLPTNLKLTDPPSESSDEEMEVGSSAAAESSASTS